MSPHDPAQAFTGKGALCRPRGRGRGILRRSQAHPDGGAGGLRRIRLGEIGETGNYGQYFTAWDFANGMLRDHIMYTAFNWVKYVDMLSHKDLIAVVDTEDEPYSEYLGFSGLTTLRDLR